MSDLDSSWSLNEIDLVANFEGSLSGLGVDLSDSMFDMRNTMSALPESEDADLEDSDDNKSPAQCRPTCDYNNGFSAILKAPTSPITKLDEETLTYLNQGQPYEVKLKFKGSSTFFVKSYIKVSFHERRMQFMEREHLEYWRNTRPGERLLDVDVPHSYGFQDVHADRSCLNTVVVVWNVGVDCGVYLKLHCISTEFTAKKHGGEKGVPFRLQVDTFQVDPSVHLHSCACQVKVFKPKGADRKYKTDRDKIERKSDTDRLRYRPSCVYSDLHEIPYEPPCLMSTHKPYSIDCSPVHASRNVPNTSKASGSKTSEPRTSTPHSTTNAVQSTSKMTVGSGSVCSTVASSGGDEVSSLGTSLLRDRISGGTEVNGRMAVQQTPIQNTQYMQTVTTPLQYVTQMKQETASLSPGDAKSDSDSGSGASASPELTVSSTPQDVSEWLQFFKFHQFQRLFQNYSGMDMLRLSRRDLVEVCGQVEGIRISNCLAQRPPRPRLTIYTRKENESVYFAVFLYHTTYESLVYRIATIFNAEPCHIAMLYMYGPADIFVAVTDEVIANLEDHSRFSLEVVRNSEFKAEIYMKPQAS